MAAGPIAYTYELAYHCEACAEKEFGRNEHGDITGVDSEGDAVGTLAAGDEDEWVLGGQECEVLICGTCAKELAAAHDRDCPAQDGGAGDCLMNA